MYKNKIIEFLEKKLNMNFYIFQEEQTHKSGN